MGIGWTVCTGAITVTAAGGNTDLIEINPADDKPVQLCGFTISQISEVGDTAEEGIQLSVMILPATFTSGSGGGTPTPRNPQRTPGATVGFTAESNNATVATTTGTAEIADNFGWNNRMSPFTHWYPDEKFMPKARQGEGLIIRMDTTLADDATFVVTAYTEEL
jgi:hypothetical protein